MQHIDTEIEEKINMIETLDNFSIKTRSIIIKSEETDEDEVPVDNCKVSMKKEENERSKSYIKAEEIEIESEERDEEELPVLNCCRGIKIEEANSCIKTEEFEIKNEEAVEENEEREISSNGLKDTGVEKEYDLNCLKPMKTPILSALLSNKCKGKSLSKHYETCHMNHQLLHKYPLEEQLNSCNECKFATKHKGKTTILSALLTNKCKGKSTSKHCGTCHLNHQSLHKDPSEEQHYSCGECDDKSTQKSNSSRHPTNLCQVKMCDKCKFITKVRYRLGLRQLRHKNSSGVAMFNNHILKHRDPSEVQMRCEDIKVHKDPSQVRMCRCNQCKFKTKKVNLKQHQLRHRDPSQMHKKFKCNECDYKSSHKFCFRMHLLKHQNPSKVQKIMYRCDECDFKSMYKANLKQNQLRHKEPVPIYKCDECDFTSIHKSALKLHQLRHKDPSEVQMFQCDECDYKSIRKDTLRQHQLRHEKRTVTQKEMSRGPAKVRIQRCDKCDYKTLKSQDLIQHLLKHKNQWRAVY